MNYLVAFLLLIASTCVRAQKMDAALNAAFADIAETEVSPGFRGDWSTTDARGIKYRMDTREAFIFIRYRGTDTVAMERAKSKAAVVRDWHGLPDPPRAVGPN